MSKAVPQNRHELEVRGILNAQSIKRLAHSALALSMNELNQSDLPAVTMEAISVAYKYNGLDDDPVKRARWRRGGPERVYRSSRIEIAEGMAGIFQPSLVTLDRIGDAETETAIHIEGGLSFDNLELGAGLRNHLLSHNLIAYAPQITVPDLSLTGSIASVATVNQGLRLVTGSSSYFEAPTTQMDLETVIAIGELVS